MTSELGELGVAATAAAIRSGHTSARKRTEEALKAIEAHNPRVNAVTRILTERALAEADRVDAKLAAGDDPGPLAGVPFAVKDLFDVAGLPTTAGAGRLENAPPAKADAEAIRLLCEAGAVLVASCNMDEFAYGFVTDNARWGLTRNPHDTGRFAGGSSGGSAAAVAAGMVPLALGSDTNGSVRIPASLCGLFGTKPTHGSLPMEGVYPFVETLDDMGAFTRTARDLTLVDEVLRGGRSEATPITRAAMLGGWFGANLSPGMTDALTVLSDALGGLPTVEVAADVARARSAAFLVTAYEGGRLHLDALRSDPLSFDPATRDRLLAGAALPVELYEEALAHREVFGAAMATLLAEYDVLIAPITQGPAPRIDHPFIPIDGEDQPVRANIGLYTQPISYLGLPVVAAPLPVEGLPLGVQIIGAKGRDRALLAYAAALEERGLLGHRGGAAR